MLLVMGIGLYISRASLQILGVSDYGLYNVVGGVVSMFAFLNGVLSGGTSRFITYELGTGNMTSLREVFNVALVSHMALAGIVFLIAETAGLWFVNTHLVFPPDRTVAVNVVYQLSVATLMLQLTQVPYSAAVIAHEKMNIYAYVSLLEVFLKLGAVFLLVRNRHTDSLILYGILLFLVQAVIICVYRGYCHRQYPESRWKFCSDTGRYKDIFAFSGWDVIGSSTVFVRGQGLNILLNIFFGPVANAAQAVCSQVEMGVSQLTNGFTTAVSPQLVKSYAARAYNEMLRLLNDSSRYSFYLLAMFIFPLLFKLDFILRLWLEKVPPQAEAFTSLTLIFLLTRGTARPVVMGIHATGNIRRLNLWAGMIGIVPLPAIYVMFRYGCAAKSAYWVLMITGVAASLAELLALKRELPQFRITEYFLSVTGRCIMVSVMALPAGYALALATPDHIGCFFLYYSVSVLWNGLVVLGVGFDKENRKRILCFLWTKLKFTRYDNL